MLKFDLNLVWTIVNLLILYFLMKKFLFGRINAIIAKRQEEADAQFAIAGEKQKEAEKLATEAGTEMDTAKRAEAPTAVLESGRELTATISSDDTVTELKMELPADLTEEQTTRNDMDCIPVIFMGYYGGWNHDPAELADQQEQILNTFQNKDQFIVVGTRPMDGSVTSEALDQVLSQKWGEHYISLADVTAQPSSTYEAQQAMAETVLQKMEELGYLSQKESTDSVEGAE